MCQTGARRCALAQRGQQTGERADRKQWDQRQAEARVVANQTGHPLALRQDQDQVLPIPGTGSVAHLEENVEAAWSASPS